MSQHIVLHQQICGLNPSVPFFGEKTFPTHLFLVTRFPFIKFQYIYVNLNFRLKYGRWLLYSKLLHIVMPNASATRSFGYYSRHAVCLPNIFADNSDESWSYSVILVLINLSAFVFMLFGYIVIYKYVLFSLSLSHANNSSLHWIHHLWRLVVRLQSRYTRNGYIQYPRNDYPQPTHKLLQFLFSQCHLLMS